MNCWVVRGGTMLGEGEGEEGKRGVRREGNTGL